MEVKIEKLDIVKISFLAFALIGFSLWLQGDIGLNLADEGYLWYGAVHTAAGKVPLKDFQSYDPGRYYWVAAWTYLLGNGIMAVRYSAGIFAAIGLTFGLLAARRAVSSYWQLLLVGVLLLVWIYPRHKFVEPAMAMSAVFFGIRLIEKPSLLRHFSAGAFVGIAAFFGRNHGLYGFLAYTLLILFIFFQEDHGGLIKRYFVFLSGVITGYSPMLIMMLCVPGFLDKLLESITLLFKWGHTNLPLPVPWPWSVDYTSLTLLQGSSKFLTGVFFLLMPVFLLFSFAGQLIIRENMQKRALLISSTLVGIFYMHYAFSRADFGHLSQGFHPFLLGIISLPSSFGVGGRKTVLPAIIAGILLMTYFTAAMASPYFDRQRAPEAGFVQVEVLRDNLWLPKRQAQEIDNIKLIVAEKVKPDEGLLIAPHWPAMYSLLNRESPLWEIYFVIPAPEELQLTEILALKKKNVRWAIIGDVRLDGRDDLRFRNTHNLVWQYLMAEFTLVNVHGLPDNYQLLHRTL